MTNLPVPLYPPCRTPYSSNESRAFSVVSSNCFGQHTHTHVLGLNLGANNGQSMGYCGDTVANP